MSTFVPDNALPVELCSQKSDCSTDFGAFEESEWDTPRTSDDSPAEFYVPTGSAEEAAEEEPVADSSAKKANQWLDEEYRVERFHYTELSPAELRRKIQVSRNPIVITGLGPHILNHQQDPLSIDFLRTNMRPNVKVCVRNKDETEKDVLMEDFWREFDDIEDSVAAGDEARGIYLKDASIATHYPWLFQEHVRIPKHFLHCFKHRTRSNTFHGSAYVHPSLFLGNARTKTDLHTDPWPTNFWCYMIEGSKQWTTFHPDDRDLLEPEITLEEPAQKFRSVRELEVAGIIPERVWNGAEWEFLNVTERNQRVRRLDFTVNEGEVLFNPAETPHEVVNLSKSLGLVALFLDQSNIDRCVAHTQDIIEKVENRLAQLDGAELPHPENAVYAAGLGRAELEKRVARRKQMHQALDEIEWPELEDDLDFVESYFKPSEEEELAALMRGETLVGGRDEVVGLFPLNHQSKTDERTRLR